MRPPFCRLASTRPTLSTTTRWTASRALTTSPGLELLQHHHLTSDSPHGLVNYDDASDLQESLRSEFLAWKSKGQPKHESQPSAGCPRPRLISFESTPTFTLGRRQDDLTPAQTAHLQRPLRVDLPNRTSPVLDAIYTPEVRKTNRGGLTTYHGPGQIVFWPVLDMRSPLHAAYGVESYASHLESTTQRLLAEHFGIATYISRDDPGVWVVTPSEKHPPRKIAALGVHQRRYVTALGIALNIDIPVTGGEDVNPWARFVPCGLEGKLVTSVAAETGGVAGAWDIPGLARTWAGLFEEGLGDAKLRAYDTASSRSR